MKIRIKGNSLRLRLTQSEVDQFKKEGIVKEFIQFGTDATQQLIYSLEIADQAKLGAIFGGNQIRVFVPKLLAEQWVNSNQVGLEEKHVLGSNNSLHLLIEKDFQCLNVRPGEDESDNYPNPSQKNKHN